MTTGEFCTREVVVTEKGTGILEVARLMREYHVGDVIVVEHRDKKTFPVGIITDRDIVVEVVAQEVDPDTVVAGDIMSSDLASVNEETGIWETLITMRGRGVRRIPVVNGEGSLVGILAVDDLIELLAEELALLAKVIGSGPEREREKLA